MAKELSSNLQTDYSVTLVKAFEKLYSIQAHLVSKTISTDAQAGSHAHGVASGVCLASYSNTAIVIRRVQNTDTTLLILCLGT